MIIFDTDLIFEKIDYVSSAHLTHITFLLKSILSKTEPRIKNRHSTFSIYFRFASEFCVHRVYNRVRSFVQLIIFQVLHVLFRIAI